MEPLRLQVNLQLKANIFLIKNQQKIYTNQSLEINKRKVHLPFIDNIWGADLADTQLISKCNKEFIFVQCVIDIYNKHTWVIPLKDKKETMITIAFKKISDESN